MVQQQRHHQIEGPLLGNGFTPVVTEHFVVLARPDTITVLSNTTGAVLYATSTTTTTTVRCVITKEHDNETVWVGYTNGTIQAVQVTATAWLPQKTVRIATAAQSVEELCWISSSLSSGDDGDDDIYALLYEPPPQKESSTTTTTTTTNGQYSLQHLRHNPANKDDDEDWSASAVQLDHFTGPPRTATSERHYILAGSAHGIAWSRSNKKRTSSKQILRLYNHDNVQLDLSKAPSLSGSRITALTCQVTDVAVGLDDGSIQRLQDVWSLPFGEQQQRRHRGGAKERRKSLLSSRIVRRLHWHAHAVTCLVLDGAGRLHSGGEESVWVTWDGTGDDTPLHLLPRICVGPIDHLVLHSMDSVMLVYCRAENSIRAYEMHNKRILWKHVGYTGAAASETAALAITANQAKQTIMFMGTPGKLCTFSPEQRRVVHEWVVCPYNHVSRTDVDEIPRPSITAAAHHGESSLTAHVSPTEAGPPVCTLKFWRDETTIGRSKQPQIVAAMSHPHGKLDPIRRLALHDRLAVTVGKRDFRLWHCLDESGWACFTKVTIPSGYSNLEQGADPEFSTDGSVLALSFGRFVTLWNTDPSAVTFLSSIPMEKTVRQITFCSSLRLHDMMLISTDDCVSLRTVAGEEWWRHQAKQIDHTVFAPEHEIVCIAQRSEESSSIVLLDARKGCEEEQLTEQIDGRIASIAVMEDEQDVVDVWAGETHPDSSEKLETMRLFAATVDGRLLQFYHDDETETSHPKSSGSTVNMLSTDAPRLPTLERRTKKRRIMTVTELGDVADTGKPLLQENDDIPLLRGAFVTAFVGRNILRRKTQ